MATRAEREAGIAAALSTGRNTRIIIEVYDDANVSRLSRILKAVRFSQSGDQGKITAVKELLDGRCERLGVTVMEGE